MTPTAIKGSRSPGWPWIAAIAHPDGRVEQITVATTREQAMTVASGIVRGRTKVAS